MSMKIKQWIKQIIVSFVCLGMAFSLGLGVFKPTVAQAAEMIDVYVDVEGYNLGQGFYIKPTKVSVPKGSTAEVATRRLLEQTGHTYVATGTGSNFYLARINGINNGVINPPRYITDELDAEYGKSGTLGEFDYTNTSGWMITVNHIKLPVGAGAWEVKDKDVIRWQFTVQGLGADIGVGADALYRHADKTELIRLLAEIAESTTLKQKALSAVINPLATASEVENVVQQIITHRQDAEKAKQEEQARAEAERAKQEEQARTEAEKTKQEEQAKAETERAKQEEQAKQTEKPKPNIDLVKEPLDRALKQMNETLLAHLQYVDFTLEWDVMTIARGGVDSPQVYARYYQHAVEYLKRNRDEKTGRLRYDKTSRLDPRSTEMSRAILALASLGQPIENIEGMNLFQSFTDIKHLGFQGINGTIFALIASNTNRYQSKELPKIQQQLVDEILAKQLSDGGWSLSSRTSDPDITAMALQSLAPYYYQKDPRVVAAVDRAVATLAAMMLDTGGYASGANQNKENAPSTAQVVTALSELGIDVASDTRFNRNGNNPLVALLRYQLADGSFYYTAGRGEKDKFSTEQGTYALVSYSRFAKGENRLYDMSDAKPIDKQPKDDTQKDNQTDKPNQPENPNNGNKTPQQDTGKQQNAGQSQGQQNQPNAQGRLNGTGQSNGGSTQQSSGLTGQGRGDSVSQWRNRGVSAPYTGQALANGYAQTAQTVAERGNGGRVANGQVASHQSAANQATKNNKKNGKESTQNQEVTQVSHEVVQTVNWWMYIWLVGMVLVGVVLIVIFKKKNVW